jgi:uncharacterized membrane protein YjgN (DUF898 family)
MKNSFEFTLKGKDWWGPFLGFWALYLVFYIPILVTGQMASTLGPEAAVLSTIFSLAFLVAFLFIYPIFTIVFLRIIVPRLSIGGKSFAFRGRIGKFLGMNIGRMLLSIITLTIYMPWYIRRVAAYLVSETTFDGAAPEFLGKGGKLFVYMLLALWIPLAVVIGVFAGVLGASALGGSSSTAGLSAAGALMVFLVYIVIIPFMYLTYKWLVNIRWNDVTVAWKTSFWPSCGYILGQMLLTLITLCIYWPAAFLKIYGFFVERTVLSRGDQEIGRLGFEGSIGKGFGLIWGQTLLSIITLGIYLPWAYAKIGAWIAATTCFETSATGA